MMNFSDARWLVVGLLIAAVQITDIAAFDNRLSHLTNWGMIVHMVLCFKRAIKGFLTVPEVCFGFTVACFIGAGITSIMIMDNTMIREYSETLGPVLVHVGNIFMHFIEPVSWYLVARCYVAEIKSYVTNTGVIAAFLQLDGQGSVFALTYGVVFNPAMEYKGPHIDYLVVFGSGIVAIFVAVTVFISLAQ